MSDLRLEQFLEDFETECQKANFSKNAKPVTIWVPSEFQERYKKLVKKSKKVFARKSCEALVALIKAAEEKVA